MLCDSSEDCLSESSQGKRDYLQILSQEKVSGRTQHCICDVYTLCRCEFGEYLKRPDHKQELLSQWQSEFNSLPIHQRREAAMKAELHCKVDVRAHTFHT